MSRTGDLMCKLNTIVPVSAQGACQQVAIFPELSY
jgi:hypothetical protein